MIDITFVGIRRISGLLDDAAESRWMRQPTESASELLRETLADYPPPRGYPRTGELGASWGYTMTLGSTEARSEIGNTAGHFPYVQSAERQAWMHVGYWHTDAMVAQDKEGDVVALYQDALEDLWP